MKQLIIILFLLFVAISCSTMENDCVCTQDFRAYRVTVLDSLGSSVDSLDVTVKDKDGKRLNVVQDVYDYYRGKYVVLNDGFIQMFCSCGIPQQIYFSVTDGKRTANGEYLFNTDECKCHINKIAGPDTLVLL
jgi:hypothetical protein